MVDLKLILDPGGTILRPGFNITVYPNGDIPLEETSGTQSLDRASNGALIATGYTEFLQYQWSSLITDANTRYKVEALEKAIKLAQKQYDNWEVVIYNLAQPYTELGSQRTRYLAPGTQIISQENLGNQKLFVYYIALQGFLSIKKTNFYEYQFTFQESTLLTKAMEG